MRALFTDDAGAPGTRYTVTSDNEVIGTFETQDEVVDLVRRLPDNACTIRFGAGVSWEGAESAELARKIEALDRPWVCPICGGIGWVGGSLPETCEIPERSIGNECLAMRHLDMARPAVAAKDRGQQA